MWNDRRLARRAARGDQDAFAAIFRRYEQDLYRYCVAIVGDRQDAQDALQNTMVKALRALPGERREIELKPWLYRVAHNESIELRRRARPSEPLAEELGPPVASLEETAADRVRLRDLLADIGELSERHRGALVMRELGGLDFDEIGAALDTSPAAARQVLYEARRSLQQMSDGREMRCDDITALLSDRDGRVARRRDVRAHLRDCPECRRFAEGIRGRSETLAGIAPLPALAAAAIAKGALAGSASGGAASAAGGGAAAGAGGAAGSGAAAGGAAGLAGGAAKVASTAAILKSTAAIVAVVGVGALAADQSHLFHGGGASPGTTSPAAAGTESESDPPTTDSSGTRRAALPASRYFRPTGVEEVGLKAPKPRGEKDSVTRSKVGTAEPTAVTAGLEERDAGVAGPPSDEKPHETDSSASRPHPEPPEHPAHPEHPARPTHPSHPAQSTRPSHPSHPTHPTAGSQADEKPETERGPPAETGGTSEAAAGHESEGAATEDEAPVAEEATAPEAAEPVAQSTPPAESPGQAKK